MTVHVEEFKKALGAEVHKSMAELGRMREEKKALEQNISDLFALKAKHGTMSRSNVSIPHLGLSCRVMRVGSGKGRAMERKSDVKEGKSEDGRADDVDQEGCTAGWHGNAVFSLGSGGTEGSAGGTR